MSTNQTTTQNAQTSQNSAGKEKRLAPGEFIFKEGDVGDLAYVVDSGIVEVCKISGGSYVKLQEVKKGGMFGEMALIDKTPRSASARAVTDVVVHEINEQAFQAYIKRSPEVAMNMMHRLADYVRSSHSSLAQSTFGANGGSNKKIEKVEIIESDGRPEKWDTDVDFILNEYQSPHEIIERRRFPPILIATTLIIFSMITLFFVWSAFSIIDTTISTRGRLTTSVPTIDVQATDSSVVKNIHVSIGDLVNKGDLLVTLDETFAESDWSQAEVELSRIKSVIQRLEAEMNREGVESADKIEHPIERKIFFSRAEEYSARILSFELDLKALHQKLKTTDSDIKLAKQQLAIQKELEAARLKLYKQKVGSYVNLLSAKDKTLSTSREYQNLKNSIVEYKSKIEALNSEKKAFISQRFAETGKQLSQAIEKRDDILGSMVKLGRNRENIEIFAPTDGTIIEIDDLFVGSIVNKGDTVMSLVPGNIPLHAEIDVDPRDIGYLMLGSEVSLKLDALPFQKHGDLGGELTYISEDTVDESTDGKPGTFYRAHVALTGDYLRDLPENFRLVPGMLLNGDVLAGRRRLITYFIFPVIRTIETSFSEP
ncbi:MAG: HlyD family type I secretion periplasmic adaptor subunit [Magnetococcales bacterium]|nr:HlyD family type I secretion periplasmic adaptor subunit [Magnetococcales bacterium]